MQRVDNVTAAQQMEALKEFEDKFVSSWEIEVSASGSIRGVVSKSFACSSMFLLFYQFKTKYYELQNQA